MGLQRVLSMQLCGERNGGGEVGAGFTSLWALSEEFFNPGANREGKAQIRQFTNQNPNTARDSVQCGQ